MFSENNKKYIHIYVDLTDETSVFIRYPLHAALEKTFWILFMPI